MKPSFTIPGKSQNTGSLSEPAIHGHSRPKAYQAIHFIISPFSHPKTARSSPLTATVCTIGSNKFKRFGPKFWDRSNGHLRPQANHYIIYCTIHLTFHPTARRIEHGLFVGLKIKHFGSKVWNRSNGRSWPQPTETFAKCLKEEIKPSREKPLPLGV